MFIGGSMAFIGPPPLVIVDNDEVFGLFIFEEICDMFKLELD